MITLKTPSSRRPGWEAFVLGYTSEFKVRPLHQGYVSATSLCIYIYIHILPLCRVLPPILYGSAESTFVHKMHDQVDHAGKKSGRKYLFQLAQSDTDVTLQSVQLILC